MTDEINSTYESKYWEEKNGVVKPKKGYIAIKGNASTGIEILRDPNESTVEIDTTLANPELLDLMVKEIQLKVVGETDTIKSIILTCCGIFVENHQIASYNLLINDESGAGKDFILDNILDLFPKRNVVKRTRITATAFTYWHDNKKEPEWTWDGKICALKDISNSILNSDVLKLMVSDGSSTTVVRNQFAVDITIQGKPVMLLTSYNATPNNENLRRFPFINIDSSKTQTKNIMMKQASYAVNGKKIYYDETLKDSLMYLKRVEVRIPYAKVLPQFFPDNIIMRTNFPRFLDYIKASCALYQHQRQTDNEEYYLATGQDYNNARILLLKTTSNAEMIPLNKKQRQLLDIIKSGESWSVRTLQPKVTFYALSKLYSALDSLTEKGFLKVEMDNVDGVKQAVKMYSVTGSYECHEIPTWEDIEKKIKEEKERNEIKEKKEENDNNNSHISLNSPPFL
jgi:DNA-binding PadR family transcriptional regulator